VHFVSSWLEMHELFIKLTQQAIIEASEYREEVVKELLLIHSKLPIIIHEAFCVLVWRLKVLPRLLEMEKNPKATFFLYTVLFHEANAISMLETVLYHQNMAETLGDISLDLIDYCVQAITFLIGAMNKKMEEQCGNSTQLTETTLDELKRQQEEMSFKIGIKCLTILSFVIDKLECLPLSATTRLVKTHDVPCLISEILHLRPWMRRSGKGFQKFIGKLSNILLPMFRVGLLGKLWSFFSRLKKDKLNLSQMTMEGFPSKFVDSVVIYGSMEI
jgi:zinc finger MYND domain-containing protein 10